MKDAKFKIGDVVRYDSGCTAIFKISSIGPYKSDSYHGYRMYGKHCLGGSHGAYEGDCSLATKEDIEYLKKNSMVKISLGD